MGVKVISGGQTGADQGGLMGAWEAHVETGGTAAPRFMTEEGPRDAVLKSFGLVELNEKDPDMWPKRTWRNVQDSDGTVLFGNMASPGSKMTIRYCKTNLKPYFINPTAEQLADWMEANAINILNVAGNRESKNPGIYLKTRQVIYDTLRILESRNT